MKINKLHLHQLSKMTVRWLCEILALSLLTVTAIYAAPPSTPSEILDHAINLSGVAEANSYSPDNGGFVFTDDKPAAKKPDSALAKEKQQTPTSQQQQDEMDDAAKSKKSSKSGSSEVVA